MSHEGEPVNVLLISGSTRKPSFTRSAMRAVDYALQGQNCTTYFWDLGYQRLPVANPKYHRTPEDDPRHVVHDFVMRAAQADAFVWGSPLYHNSYSGVLKGALDILSIRHIMNKPVGLVAHGAERTVVQAADHLRIVVRGLSGLAVPAQILTLESDFDKKPTGDVYPLINENVLERIATMASQIVKYAQINKG